MYELVGGVSPVERNRTPLGGILLADWRFQSPFSAAFLGSPRAVDGLRRETLSETGRMVDKRRFDTPLIDERSESSNAERLGRVMAGEEHV